jgi:metallo-beta-lactamase family protein
LTELLLFDSVSIFMSKQEKSRKHKKGKSRRWQRQPLYLHKHVMDTVERFVTDWL